MEGNGVAGPTPAPSANFTNMFPEITDKSLMPFGKYLGKPLEQVPAQYLIWLFDNGGCSHEGVRKYIN